MNVQFDTLEARREISKKIEWIFIQRINEYLGTDTWDKNEIAQRMEDRILPNGSCVTSIDGVDILEFLRIEYETRGDKVVAILQYRSIALQKEGAAEAAPISPFETVRITVSGGSTDSPGQP